MKEENKKFYRAFEERYRGSRENIKEKQEVYLPFVKPLHLKFPEGSVLDIGCGRGEWLELMQDQGIPAKGVDLDDEMIKAGLELGLEIKKGDGIVFLSNIEDESAIAITAFHVIEHISFEELQTLVSEALRILKPGGLLILETPNPENIRVSCETFYLDPTHVRPIPSNLLTFTTEYFGFSRTKVIRLQESESLSAQIFANIGQVLEGASPDYALIAQKKGDEKIIEQLNEPFSLEYGLSLPDLVEKFERRMLRYEEFVDKIIAKANKSEESSWKAEVQAAKANESAEQAWKHYQFVVNSRSWRITKPFRYLTHQIRHAKVWVKHLPHTIIQALKKMLNKYPKVKNLLLKLLSHFPGLKQKLKALTMSTKHLQESNDSIKIDPPKTLFPDNQTVSDDLKKAIEKHKE